MDRLTARRVLGVGPGASIAQIETAFRTRALTTHPDHGGDAESFRELVDARRVLCAPEHPPRFGAPVVIVPSTTLVHQLVIGIVRYLNRRQRARRVD